MLSKLSYLNILTLKIYMISLIIFMSQQNIFIIWILLEVNMMIFIMTTMINSEGESKNVMMNSTFMFMLIQMISSIMILMSMCMSEKNELSSNIMLVSLILKAGMFPTHYWIFKWGKILPYLNLTLLMTTQKIPVISMLMQSEQKSVILILSVNMIAGIMLMYQSKSLVNLMISSSIYGMLFLSLTYMMSWKFFMIYLALYLLNTMAALNHSNLKSKLSELTFYMSFAFLMALPPLSMFYMKMYILNTLIFMAGKLMLSFMWISSYIASMFYFKLSYMKMKNLKKINNSSKLAKFYQKMIIISMSQIMIW